ncbi:hypothetical protein D3C75_1143670 [compost metagenome]
MRFAQGLPNRCRRGLATVDEDLQQPFGIALGHPVRQPLVIGQQVQVFTDTVAPGIDGIDLCAAVERQETLPVRLGVQIEG